MKELLFRLLKQQEDKSYKVVGNEKHENGNIYHKKIGKKRYQDISKVDYIDTNYPEEAWYRAGGGTQGIRSNILVPFLKNYIPHDRKDQYTGIDIDGEKVFEGDEVTYKWVDGRTDKGTVTLSYGSYYIIREHESSHVLAYSAAVFYELKITAIQGVDNES